MQSCKLFGTSRLAGGFLFIQQRRLAGILQQAVLLLYSAARQELPPRGLPAPPSLFILRLNAPYK